MAKILNILSSKTLGGLEEAFINYTSALIAEGHEVTIIAHPKAQSLSALQQIKGAQLITNSYFSSALSNKNPITKLFAKYFARKIKPNLVIIHNSRTLGLFNNTLVVNHGYNPKRIKAADKVICVNSRIKSETENLANKKVFVLHNALAEIPPLSARKDVKNPPVIGFMGRLTHQKGVDIFIKSIKNLDVKAIIAGSGEDEDKTKQLISDIGIHNKVEMLGWVQSKKDFYSKIDIFCAPSRYEGFGMVILEAMAHSVPVITTFSDGPKDIITNYHNGIMVDTESPEQLENAIRELLANKELYKNIKDEAYKTLIEKFSFASFSKNLNGIVEKCASYS